MKRFLGVLLALLLLHASWLFVGWKRKPPVSLRATVQRAPSSLPICWQQLNQSYEGLGENSASELPACRVPTLAFVNFSAQLLVVTHDDCFEYPRMASILAGTVTAGVGYNGKVAPDPPRTTVLPLLGRQIPIKPFSYLGIRCGPKKLTNWFNLISGGRAKEPPPPPTSPRPAPLARALPGPAPHIVLIGVDSLSRLQFARHFPRTRAALADGWTAHRTLLNVLGDGTLKAMGPLLVGQDFGDDRPCVYDACHGNHSLNELPWLPDLLRRSEHHYLSGFTSDFVRGVFRLRLNGFRGKHAFDYTTDGFFGQRKFLFGRSFAGDDRLCVGQQTPTGHHLDFVRSLLAAGNAAHRPVFAVIHTGEGHEETGLKVGLVDRPLARFLHEYRHQATNQQRDRPLVVLLYGDHGPRYGAARHLQEGFLEERLPFFRLLLPSEKKESGPTVENRLATFYDVHETLRHLTGLPPHPLRRGHSLFKTRPTTATCQSLTIEPQWCACNAWQPAATDGTSAAGHFFDWMGQAALQFINEQTGSGAGPCALLTLDKVLSVRQTTTAPPSSPHHHQSTLFSLHLTAGPQVDFDVIVKAPRTTNATVDRSAKLEILSVSRTSRYQHQQTCQHEFPQPFCLCKNWHP